MLVFLLAFAMSAASLIVLGDQVLENPLLLKYGLLPLSLLMTAGVTAFVHWRARPRTGQASYYQPVRVVEVRREFFSGMVTSIRFSFANRDYQAAFEAANQREIASLLLTVKSR
ncbi:hypothetical protein [Andreprevotia lacus]|nr:hypothetical protein [Andreprevotia lacus]